MLYSQQKMFRLREDIRVFSDESQSQELLLIKARSIIDFSAAYDVVDAQSGMAVGVLRRKGLRSIARDEWQVLGAQDQLVGVLQEDGMGLALLRRSVLGSLLPQNYDLLINGQRAPISASASTPSAMSWIWTSPWTASTGWTAGWGSPPPSCSRPSKDARSKEVK